MPFARLTLIPGPTSSFAHSLATNLTELIARDLGKQHELTSVLLEAPDTFHWGIGTEVKETAAHLEVNITMGTSSDMQKSTFISNAMKLLRQALPDLAAATYIVIRELPASDWGYDGLTQAARAK